ncbi:MAG: hypothetical protein K6G29_07810 [Clostridiales bacterium]|nr:hypothetical protein [Clostridiales bacterium]
MKKNWIRIFVLLLAIWTVGGTGCRKEEAPRFTLPDGSLDAGADDIAVCRGSLFWCSDGSLLMQSGEESEVILADAQIRCISADGERLLCADQDGSLTFGIPSSDGFRITGREVLPLLEGSIVTGVLLAGDTVACLWRETVNGADHLGFYNLKNHDFFEDTPVTGQAYLAHGGDGRIFVGWNLIEIGGIVLYDFHVQSMKRGSFSTEDHMGNPTDIAALGYNDADGCLYVLDGRTDGAHLYRWDAAGHGGQADSVIPAEAIRNQPRKLLFADGCAVVLAWITEKITVCRDFLAEEEAEDKAVTVLVSEGFYNDLDNLSEVLLSEHGVRLNVKVVKSEVLSTKLLAGDDDFDLYLAYATQLPLGYPIWEPLEDYPLIAEQTALFDDDILRVCTVRGHIFGLPYFMQLANCIYPWNTALADELGIEKPAPGWTMDDSLTLARDLRQRGYYLAQDAWLLTLRDYMYRYFDAWETGGLTDDGTVLRAYLQWGKALIDEDLLFHGDWNEAASSGKVLISGRRIMNLLWGNHGEYVTRPNFDGEEVYSDTATFLVMNPKSTRKTAASAVLAEMIDPDNHRYTYPAQNVYYYKDFSLYSFNNLRDPEFFIEDEKRRGDYTDIWNMDEETQENYALYRHIMAHFRVGQEFTDEWLSFAYEEADKYWNNEQDLEYTVERMMNRARMVFEG